MGALGYKSQKIKQLQFKCILRRPTLYPTELQPPPFRVAVKNESSYLYWQCFPREEITIILEDKGFATEDIGLEKNCGGITIKAWLDGITHVYFMRRYEGIDTVEKIFNLWQRLMKNEKYVCLAGRYGFRQAVAYIRSSERRMYQKIADIYAQCSADYSPDSDITKQFFATVQNKLHFAITDKTAAEIIHERANSLRSNMGLTVWRNSPKGKIREADVVIAKNYLDKKELDHLNRIVTMYLDFAEMQAHRGVIMYMKDWVSKLDAFLKLNEKQILTNAGLISHEVAESLALKKYEKYSKEQDKKYISDFDREIRKLLEVDKKMRINRDNFLLFSVCVDFAGIGRALLAKSSGRPVL